MLNEEKENQRNMMIALVLIVAVFMVPRFFAKPRVEAVDVPLTVAEEVVPVTETVKVEPAVQPTKGETLPIENSFLAGSFLSNGTRVDALDLTQYRETVAKDSPAVALLTKDFYTDVNWVGDSLPDTRNAPQVEGKTLSPETPITLIWENASARIERTISLDNAYLMTFSDKVINKSGAPMKASLVGQVVRNAEAVPDGRSTVHEGFLGLFDNKEKESRYMEITADKSFVVENKGGWIGQTDKYWQAIFVPDQNAVSQMRFEREGDIYKSSFKTDTEIGAGKSVTRTTKLFAGVKELELINTYEKEGIPRFDL